MTESRLLVLIARYPHQTALARRVRDGSVFSVLNRLERGGLVRRHGDLYRLTHRGQSELAMTRKLILLVAR